MERKEAIEVIKKNYPDSSFTMLREALETLIPELKESEDERIRKELVQFFEEKDEEDFEEWIPKAKVLAWLGKQGEHAKFRDSIQVGDKLTLNEDGVLVNLSQLNRVAKKDEKQGEQNPAWSEEDKKKVNNLYVLLDQMVSFNMLSDKDATEFKDWLKSLKDIVQPQQEWSKDSKRKMRRIYSILGQAADTHAFSTTCRLIGDKECIKLQDFLKSLTPQSTWKPSDEQMNTLEYYMHTLICNEHKEILFGLYTDLKKLKG